jgi:hypothetical protein
MIFDPGSPFPVKVGVELSVFLLSIVVAAASLTVKLIDFLASSIPDGLVSVAVTVPAFWAESGVTDHFPSNPTTAFFVEPSGNTTVIVFPGLAEPEIVALGFVLVESIGLITRAAVELEETLEDELETEELELNELDTLLTDEAWALDAGT